MDCTHHSHQTGMSVSARQKPRQFMADELNELMITTSVEIQTLESFSHLLQSWGKSLWYTSTFKEGANFLNSSRHCASKVGGTRRQVAFNFRLFCWLFTNRLTSSKVEWSPLGLARIRPMRTSDLPIQTSDASQPPRI